MSQKAKVKGQNNIIIQVQGDGNTIVPGLPHLTLTRYLTHRQKTESHVDLLNPYGRTIDLVGRETELAELRDWAENGQPISIRVLTGSAGTGKTRLALEFAENLIEDGWVAGFVKTGELERFIAQTNLSTWGWQEPTLIIIDYAVTRATLLRKWLTELSDNIGNPGRPLRILILERHAESSGGWWQVAFGIGGGEAKAIQRLLDPKEPVRLSALEGSDSRRKILTAILETANSAIRLPSTDSNPDFDRKLATLSWGGTPLFLMAAGLAAVRHGLPHVLTLGRADLAFDIAGHELNRLELLAKEREVDSQFFGHIAAYITLCQGLSREELIEVIETEKEALKWNEAGATPKISDALEDALLQENGEISPILPDVIGEAVILKGLYKPSLSDQHATTEQTAAVERAANRYLNPVVSTIIKTAQDFGLEGYVAPLAWLARVSRKEKVDLSTLLEISGQLPSTTLVLREQAAEICGAITERTRNLVERDPNEETKSLHAKSLVNLGNCLRALEQREEACAVGQEALKIYRALAASQPESFNPQLAVALNNLGAFLDDLGRPEEALVAAQEALKIHQELAVARPEVFEPFVALSLNNWGKSLDGLGRPEEALAAAQAALKIYQELAVARPEVFKPDVAFSLNNLGKFLDGLGRREEALAAIREALEIYRELAVVRPDTFLPVVAAVVGNFGPVLSQLGRREEALVAAHEALDIRRELATARPLVFNKDVAFSLTNLGVNLSDLGRPEEALAAAQEALKIYQELAVARPEVFKPDVAFSLNNLGVFLKDLGRPDEALTAAQEAIKSYQELAAGRAKTFKPNIALSFRNFSTILKDLGRREEALAAGQETLKVYQELAGDQPDAFLPDVATSHNNLSTFLSGLGRKEEALVSVQKALTIRKELAVARPEVFKPDVAFSLNNLGTYLRDLGRREEAVAAVQESVETLLPIFLKYPKAFKQTMAGMVKNYIRFCIELSQESDVVLLNSIAQVIKKLESDKGEEKGS